MSLRKTTLPSPLARHTWDNLVGLDGHKQALLDSLEILLAPDRFAAWQRQHHPRGLKLAELVNRSAPLVVLSGDVGCGKTAMATGVGHPLSKRLDAQVALLEAPTGIRGKGLVGEMSSNIAETFAKALREVPRKGYALLLLDEGDDLATSREQLQAHHEDRAGVNALIKEIDNFAGDAGRIAVILCTNRGSALDPALLRRAALHLRFERPTGEALRGLFNLVLDGVQVDDEGFNHLLQCLPTNPPYTPSDLIHRVGRRAVLEAYREGRSVCLADFEAAVENVAPTPVFGNGERT